MRRINSRVLTLFFLALVLSPVRLNPPAQAEADVYSSVAEALREAKGNRHGWLSEAAALHLLRELSLDWKFTKGLRINSWDDVRAHSSDNGEFYVLVGARAGEWGQHGHASYCLIDTTGTIHWKRKGRVNAPPLVSNQGVTALIHAEGESWIRGHPGPVRIDFIGITGDSLGSVRWDRRVSRPLQRYFLQEHTRFTPDGGLLLTTMNLRPESDTGEVHGYNNTVLFAVKPDGSEAWRHNLGGFWPKRMEFQDGSESVRISGEWRERLILDESFDEGFIVFDLDGNVIEKTITRHIDPPDFEK